MAELDDDQSGGIDFAEFLRLATAKISDKDSRQEIDKVFASFDVNRAVINWLKLGKNHCSRIKKDSTRFGWRFDWWRNWKNVCQGWSWWWWICHRWWFLQHHDSQSLLGSMIHITWSVWTHLFISSSFKSFILIQI